VQVDLDAAEFSEQFLAGRQVDQVDLALAQEAQAALLRGIGAVSVGAQL